MGLLDKWLNNYVSKHEGEFFTAIDRINNGGTMNDLDTVVDDYFYLIKKVHKLGKPQRVMLFDDDYCAASVDGVAYDFDVFIHHNDSAGANCKYELEALLGGGKIPTKIIEEKLNKKIAEKW